MWLRDLCSSHIPRVDRHLMASISSTSQTATARGAGTGSLSVGSAIYVHHERERTGEKVDQELTS